MSLSEDFTSDEIGISFSNIVDTSSSGQPTTVLEANDANNDALDADVEAQDEPIEIPRGLDDNSESFLISFQKVERFVSNLITIQVQRIGNCFWED